MHLRTNLRAPARFEDQETHVDMRKQKNTTTPAFPELLQQQVISFNKDNAEASFPSLSITSAEESTTRSLSHSLRVDQHTSQSNANSQPIASFTNLDQSAFTGVVDFSHANDVVSQSQGVGHDEFGTFELELEGGEEIRWASLELSVQCQIYKHLTRFHGPDATGGLLGLTDAEDAQMRCDHRRQTPSASWEAWHYLQTGRCVGPELLQTFLHDLTFDAKYDEAYPISVQRGTQYLQQHNLVPALLGDWYLSPDGSGMLRCACAPVTPQSATIPDSGYGSGSDSFAEPSPPLPSTVRQSQRTAIIPPVPSLTKRQRKASADSMDTEADARKPARPKKASKKNALPLLKPGSHSPTHTKKPATSLKLSLLTDSKKMEAESGPPTPPRPSGQNRSRPAPIQIGGGSYLVGSNTSSATSSGNVTGSGGPRAAGSITLRDRTKLRPTERSADMISTPDFPHAADGIAKKRHGVTASPSSPFVTLKTMHVPRLSIDTKTGRAEITSSPITRSSGEVSHGILSGSPMEGILMFPNRALPNDAADAIAMDRRNSSVASQNPLGPMNSNQSWRYPQLMHDPDLFTSCFKKMPEEEQERLLELHPAERNAVQTWLIYGSEAWNKNRLWNAKFQSNQHGGPTVGKPWDPEAAGSVLGKSVMAQWNVCQELGLGQEYSESARIGEEVIKGYGALSRMRASIAASTMQMNSNSPSNRVGGSIALTASDITNEQAKYNMTEANLWQELKNKYRKELISAPSDKLEAMSCPMVILFDVRSEPCVQPDGRVLSTALKNSSQTPAQLDENVFTSKALGLGTFKDQGFSLSTPGPKDLGIFTQNSAERPGHEELFSIRSEVEGSPLQNRGTANQIKQTTGDTDVLMVDISPKLAEHDIIPEVHDRGKHTQQARSSESKTLAKPSNEDDKQKPSLTSPSVSPIDLAEIQAFVDTRDEQAREAATLLFKVSATSSAPAPPIIKSADNDQEKPVPANENITVEEEQYNVAERDSLPVPTDENGGPCPDDEVDPANPTRIKLNVGQVTGSGTSSLADTRRGRSLSSIKEALTEQEQARKDAATPKPLSRDSTAALIPSQTAFLDSKPSDSRRSRRSTPTNMQGDTAHAFSKSHALSLHGDTLVTQAAKVEKKLNAETDLKAGVETEDDTDELAMPMTAKKVTEKDGVVSGPDVQKTARKDKGKKRGPYRKTREKEAAARARAEEERAAEADYELAKGDRK